VLLGERDHVNLIEQLELSQNFKCYIKLTFTAVDDPEVGIFALGDGSLQAPAQHLVHAGEIVLAVDGADEIDPELGLIKGRGGALFREKLLAINSERFVVVADDSKLVSRLGVGVLPVEILPFLWRQTARHFAERGIAWQLRGGEEAPFLTDNGNLVLDLTLQGGIENPLQLAGEIKLIPGVCEHGLFIGVATAAIIAGEGGVRMLGHIE